MQTNPTVAIIVLNWNGWKDTVECLESLQHLTYPCYQIILIDNGSSDDSIAKIKSWCRGEIIVDTALVKFSHELKPVEYIEFDRLSAEKNKNTGSPIINHPPYKKLITIKLDENKGFAEGNNAGITYALKKGYKYIWLLNNDMVVNEDALVEMIKVAQSDKRIGMVGSKFYDYTRPNIIQYLGSNKIILTPRNENSLSTEESIKESVEFKVLCAGSLLVKRAIIEQIGTFDKNYFFSYEDIDWCIRARKKGWKLYCALKSEVWHKHGASTGSKKIDKYFLGRRFTRICWEGFRISVYYESRNSIYFVKQNYPLYFIPYLIYVLSVRIIKIFIFDDHKIARSKIILRGAWDVLIGRMGRGI